MTTLKLIETFNLDVLSKGQDMEITCGFSGDLLSWAMANAPENCVWLTVMGNINAIAVASLNDVACLVLCQGSSLNEDALNKAIEREINVFSTKMSAFQLAGKLAELV